jgi:hypothetical protein
MEEMDVDAVYRAVFVDVWPWWVGGPAVGLFVLAFLLAKNRLLSASATYQFLSERVTARVARRPDSMEDWLTGLSPDDPEFGWQGRFFAGLLLGGAAGAVLAGAFPADPSLPGLAAVYPAGPAAQAALLGFSGLLIGFGTRMSGGCTSGHCIVGVSGLQAPSAAATAVFFAVGIAASFAAEALARGWAA